MTKIDVAPVRKIENDEAATTAKREMVTDDGLKKRGIVDPPDIYHPVTTTNPTA